MYLQLKSGEARWSSSVFDAASAHGVMLHAT